MPSSPIRCETATACTSGRAANSSASSRITSSARRVPDVLELGHRPAAVVVADHAGEGDDGAGGLVGHGVLVLGDGQRRVDDPGDHGAEGTPDGGDVEVGRIGQPGAVDLERRRARPGSGARPRRRSRSRPRRPSARGRAAPGGRGRRRRWPPPARRARRAPPSAPARPGSCPACRRAAAGRRRSGPATPAARRARCAARRPCRSPSPCWPARWRRRGPPCRHTSTACAPEDDEHRVADRRAPSATARSTSRLPSYSTSALGMP